MPKINQEEYEILKKIDDGYKWIARDEDRGLYAFTKKPVRKDGYSSYWRVAELEDPYTALGLFDEIHLFQFIKWENEEPYDIAELIEGYESEETEVKKNIEWLKEKVQKRIDKLPGTYSGLYIEGSRDAYHLALKDIDQLDEPEVLSQEWIDECSYNIEEYWQVADMMDGPQYAVSVENLQNLLVPKQEKVEVPRFVADILEENTFADLPTAFEELFSANAGHYYGEDVCKWIVSNEEAFARAWLDGYEVTEE